MEIMKTNFKTNSEYKQKLAQYTRVDGIIAVLVYALVMGMYYVMGVIYDTKDLYLGNQFNIFIAVICIVSVLLRRQKLNSIGFNKKNFSKSLRMGLLFGCIALIIQLVIGVMSKSQFSSVSSLFKNFLYYFIIIALVEEIVFRGFIQTRLYGLIKKPWLAILVAAIMFMTMHIPFQMGAAHMGFIEFIANNFVTLIFTFVWHYVFNFMYSKYDSIVAPTAFHTIMNWSNYLFK